MTVTEFLEKVARNGLKGKVIINDRRRHLGFGMGALELSMDNGENDMIEASDFGRYTIDEVAYSPCPMHKANATHQGRGYYIKDL